MWSAGEQTPREARGGSSLTATPHLPAASLAVASGGTSGAIAAATAAPAIATATAAPASDTATAAPASVASGCAHSVQAAGKSVAAKARTSCEPQTNASTEAEAVAVAVAGARACGGTSEREMRVGEVLVAQAARQPWRAGLIGCLAGRVSAGVKQHVMSRVSG